MTPMLHELNVDIGKPEFGTPRTSERKIRGLLTLHGVDAYVDTSTEDIIKRPGERYLYITADCSPETTKKLTHKIRDIDGVVAVSSGETSHDLHC